MNQYAGKKNFTQVVADMLVDVFYIKRNDMENKRRTAIFSHVEEFFVDIILREFYRIHFSVTLTLSPI